jgi:Flp pilus assembly protein TadD
VQQQPEPLEYPQNDSEQVKPPESEELEDILANLRATIDSTLQPAQQQPQVSSDALYREAQEHIEAGTPSKAIASLEKLVVLDPGNALAHNDLGVLYIRSGDAEKACFHQEAAVRFNPQSPVYRKNLASLYYACLGKTDEAIDLYTKLITEYPNDVEILSALAIISESNNLREQARTFIDKVLSIEPWNSNAREFLARL